MLYLAHRLAATHTHTVCERPFFWSVVFLLLPLFSPTLVFHSYSAVPDALNGRNSNNRICVRFTLPPPPPLFTLCNKTALFAVVLFLVFVFVFFLPKL